MDRSHEEARVYRWTLGDKRVRQGSSFQCLCEADNLVCLGRAPLRCSQTGLSASLSLSLRFSHDLFRLYEAIRIYRNGIDAAFHEERGEVRIITRRLAADADFAIPFVGRVNDFAHRVFHRFVPLVEQLSQLGRIAIHAEHKLGEVVATDGEAVETFAKFFGEDDVRWYFTHHINLQPLTAAHEAIPGELTQDFVGFIECAAERHHHDHVG